MKPEQFNKLPKYAQEEITDLRRDVEGFQRALKEQQQDTPSNIEWGSHFIAIHSKGYLPDDAQVTFRVSVRPEFRIRARISEEGLHLSADGGLLIQCESSNCFTVKERPR